MPNPKQKPLRIRFIYGDKKLSVEELKKSMKLCFDDAEDVIMRMPRPGQRTDEEDAGPVLTVRVVDPKAQDQVAKQEPQPEQEPSDDEFEGEIQRLEQKKAATLDKGKKNMNISRDGR